MEVTHPLPEDRIPVDITGLELGNRRIAAVRAALRPAASEAALDEIETVAHFTADTVERHPADERGVHAALQDEILHQTPDRIVGKGGDHRGTQTETATQTAGDIVFAAALPDVEFAGGVNSPLARIEPEHDFTEADFIKTARFRGFVLQHDYFPSLSSTAFFTVARIPSQFPEAISSALPSQVPPTATTSLMAR